MPAPSRLRSFVWLTLALVTACASPAQPPASEPEPPPGASGSRVGSDQPGRSSTGTQGRADRRGPGARDHRASTSPDAEPELPPLAAAFVAAHNLHRAEVSPPASPALPPVRWSAELAAHAQSWAERCTFEHSQTDAGENLAARSYLATPEEIVAGWAAEGEHFDHARNRCAAGEVCGHYTQVVWRDSTRIGCGVAQCPSGGPFGEHEWVLSVCNYSPAGNWQGQKPY